MLSHRPHGSGHPYRYDLDQRVPPYPLVGEAYEIRVLSDSPVVVHFADRSESAVRKQQLTVDYGPQPAPGSSDGHLAAAAGFEAQPTWVASVVSTVDEAYWVEAGGERIGPFPVEPLRWQETGGRLAMSDPGRLIPDSVRWLVGSSGPRRVRFSLRLEPQAHVVGFGERFHALDQRGEVLDTVVFEQYKRQGHRTYLPMPFAIVDSGWGFHVDTGRRAWFSIDSVISVEAEVDPAQPSLSVSIYEGDPATVLRAFQAETGTPIVPPDWVFRPWMSGNEWNTQERVLSEVERSLAEDIPVGAVVIEAWSDESTFVVFRGEGAWPDPKSMVDRLHSLGVRVLLWQIPLIPDGIPDAEELVAKGFAVREADGTPYHNRGWWFPKAVLPDFTNPAAVDWWLAKRRYLVDELGIDGFKTDGGEHAWGHDLRYFDGSRGDESNSRFPQRYAAAYQRLSPVTFSRAGYTGSAATGLYWSGDEDSTWAAYRAAITAGLTAGTSGIYWWGWDLAGFSGEIPDAELYLRAAGMACFCPIMQYHSEFNHHRQPSRDRTPWNIAERTGDPRVLPTYRRFAHIREALVPYLVEQAHRSVESGRPLMRPLFFDFGDDPRIWAYPSQYLLGDDLLVSPVTAEGATDWPVYLPAGEWEDLFTGTVHTGPSEVRRATPLDEIPVYLRRPASTLLQAVSRVAR